MSGMALSQINACGSLNGLLFIFLQFIILNLILVGFYRDLVAAIRGEAEVVVRPEVSRDGIRIIELARESAEKGSTVPFK